MTWHACEVANLPSGQPALVLHGALQAWFAQRRLSAHLSVSDESDYTAASAWWNNAAIPTRHPLKFEPNWLPAPARWAQPAIQ